MLDNKELMTKLKAEHLPLYLYKLYKEVQPFPSSHSTAAIETTPFRLPLPSLGRTYRSSLILFRSQPEEAMLKQIVALCKYYSGASAGTLGVIIIVFALFLSSPAMAVLVITGLLARAIEFAYLSSRAVGSASGNLCRFLIATSIPWEVADHLYRGAAGLGRFAWKVTVTLLE